MNRRGFLRVLGISPAVAIAPATERAAGLGGEVLSALGYAGAGIGLGGPPAAGASQATRLATAVAYFSTHGVPEFLAKRNRSNALRNVAKLDADLASNRSFSLSAKIRMQAARNVDHVHFAVVEDAKYQMARDAFSSIQGFDVW